jgi:hypothetical protein
MVNLLGDEGEMCILELVASAFGVKWRIAGLAVDFSFPGDYYKGACLSRFRSCTMSRHRCGLLLIGLFAFLLAPAAWGQDEMVANPYYKFWAGFKPGAQAVHIEKTKLSGAEGKLVPDGVDEKRIAYKLLSVTKDRVVVEMVVREHDFLGTVEAAPTRHIYPTKLKKSHIERILLARGGKAGEDTVKVGVKELKCKTVAGTIKGPGGEVTEFKLWLSDDVPGKIVKHVRTTRQKGDVIAETTTTLLSYRKAAKAKGGTKTKSGR